MKTNYPCFLSLSRNVKHIYVRNRNRYYFSTVGDVACMLLCLPLSTLQHIWEYFLVTGAPSPTYVFSVLIHSLNWMDCFLWALPNLLPYTCIFYKLAFSVFLTPGFLHWQTNSLPIRHEGSPFHMPVFSINGHLVYSWIQFPILM